MFDQMKKLMEMKKQADQINRELDSERIDVNDVNGIRIEVNGSQEILSVEIDESLLNPNNKQKLENDFKRSINCYQHYQESVLDY